MAPDEHLAAAVFGNELYQDVEVTMVADHVWEVTMVADHIWVVDKLT